MKIAYPTLLNFSCMPIVLLLLFLTSCGKDGEIFTDYVVDQTTKENPDEEESPDEEDRTSIVVIDDFFTIPTSSAHNFNVLENDTISYGYEITLTIANNPKNGTVSINKDNTIAYTAPNISEGISDTFSYTAETMDEQGNILSETANVTVTITSSPQEDTDIGNYLFTEQAKAVLKQRFENNYTAGPGFHADFDYIKNLLPEFVTNPALYRPRFGRSIDISNNGEAIHMAGLYAYAMDDFDIANIIAEELLETVNANDLSDSFWSEGHNFSTEYDLFIQTAKAKKLKDTYSLIINVQSVLTQNQKNTIEDWFKDYKDHVRNWFVPRTENYIGVGWEDNGILKANPEGIYPADHGDPFPLDDANGNPLSDYTMSWFQNLFSNRMMDNVAYLHSWAVYNADRELEHYTREYFKLVIKYGTFSDGTFWELIRNKETDNTLGVFYTNVTLTSLVYMAHLDSQAKHFPNDLLYEYSTNEGIINGSTNFTTAPYAGGSTTDGITKKSIKTIILGQSKYLRSSTNGGWNDLRYNHGKSMSTVGTRQNSVVAAIANLYYKNQDLKDYYMYNTAVGYPNKVTIYGGWGKIEDFGAWGNLIICGAWLNQEDNF